MDEGEGMREKGSQFVVEPAGDFFDFWRRQVDERERTRITAEYIANDDGDGGSLDRGEGRRPNDECRLSRLPRPRL